MSGQMLDQQLEPRQLAPAEREAGAQARKVDVPTPISEPWAMPPPTAAFSGIE